MGLLRSLVIGLFCCVWTQAKSAPASSFLDCSPTVCQQLQQLLSDFNRGHPLQASAQLNALISQLADAGETDDLASAHYYQGNFARLQSAYQDALTAYDAVLKLYPASGYGIQKAFILGEIARVFRLQGKFSAALDNAYQALQIYQKHQHLTGIAWQQITIGSILLDRGQYEPALAVLQQVTKSDTINHEPVLPGRALYFTGLTYLRLQHYALAEQYLNDARQIFAHATNPFDLALSFAALGELCLARDDLAGAQELFSNAITLFGKMNAPVELHKTQSILGLTYIAAGRHDTGLGLLNGAMQFAQQRGADELEAYLHMNLARGLLTTGAVERGLGHVEAGVKMALAQDRAGLHTDLLSLKARLLYARQDYQQAYEVQQKSYTLAANLANQARLLPIIQQSTLLQVHRQAESIESLKQTKAVALAQAEQRNLRNTLILGSVITLLLFLFLLFSRYTHHRQNMLLRQQVKARTIELESKNEQLQEAFRSLEQASLRDPLTGLYNRYYLDNRLPGELRRAQHASAELPHGELPTDTDLLCFLIDIDNFKQINDEYGHLAGDKVLVQFSRLIKEVFRDTDLQIRWGGEEFLVICRQANRENIKTLAERFRQQVKQTRFVIEKQREIKVTCCIGFSVMPLDPAGPFTTTWPTTFALIDYCLYAAKLSGKDCWVGVCEARESALSASSHSDDRQYDTSVIGRKFGLYGLSLATSLNNLANIEWPKDEN
ncbi:GGDEF domain-containing protein [Salinimonas sediminis]|uniref:diguanylate cyclase n=1 Tax=Salinimonas sediminis TaxID=2303538 RepID=A0A346NPQ1_9ALTE|nr:GGDEF domain-containing protein [Salinimonas sediminis]AXR07508.1 diguanylate cyclase [Salinimonas sediminis]